MGGGGHSWHKSDWMKKAILPAAAVTGAAFGGPELLAALGGSGGLLGADAAGAAADAGAGAWMGGAAGGLGNAAGVLPEAAGLGGGLASVPGDAPLPGLLSGQANSGFNLAKFGKNMASPIAKLGLGMTNQAPPAPAPAARPFSSQQNDPSNTQMFSSFFGNSPNGAATGLTPQQIALLQMLKGGANG
jgi:hypothetical protein